MKFSKLLLPLCLVTLGLSACGETNSSSTSSQVTSGSITSEQSSESHDSSSSETSSESGITQFDIDFEGIPYTKTYISRDYKFTGILESLEVMSWLVVDDIHEFNVQTRDEAEVDFTVKFDAEGIIEYTKKVENNKVTHSLKALKTGGTMMKIYNGDELIWRMVVNARVAIKDHQLIFNHLAKADYWGGMFTNTSKIGDFRIFFTLGDPGYYNYGTASLVENEGNHGTPEFLCLLDSAEEHNFSPFHVMSYQLQIMKPGIDITPVLMDVSLALDTVYLVDKNGIIDFFRPSSQFNI